MGWPGRSAKRTENVGSWGLEGAWPPRKAPSVMCTGHSPVLCLEQSSGLRLRVVPGWPRGLGVGDSASSSHPLVFHVKKT